jgi:hypothetical protein
MLASRLNILSLPTFVLLVIPTSFILIEQKRNHFSCARFPGEKPDYEDLLQLGNALVCTSPLVGSFSITE